MKIQTGNLDDKTIIFKSTYLEEYLELRIQISQRSKSCFSRSYKNNFQNFGSLRRNTINFQIYLESLDFPDICGMDLSWPRRKTGAPGDLLFLIPLGKLVVELEKNCGGTRLEFGGFPRPILKCLESLEISGKSVKLTRWVWSAGGSVGS